MSFLNNLSDIQVIVLKFFLGATIVIFASIAFTKETKLTVNEKGYPVGFRAQIKEIAQGKSFWKGQLAIIDKKLARLASEPEEDRKMRKELAAWEAEEARENAKIYAKHPDLRPSWAEARAASLRASADKIEEAAMYREAAKERELDIKKFNALRPIIIEQIQLH